MLLFSGCRQGFPKKFFHVTEKVLKCYRKVTDEVYTDIRKIKEGADNAPNRIRIPCDREVQTLETELFGRNPVPTELYLAGHDKMDQRRKITKFSQCP